MVISILTPSGEKNIELKNQIIKIKSPYVVINIYIESSEQGRIIIDKNEENLQNGLNMFPLNLDGKNLKQVKVIYDDNNIAIFQFSCSYLLDFDKKDIQNLMSFVDSLENSSININGKYNIMDFISKISSGEITLLQVQKPLTGYDNKLLLDKLEQSLTQKVRGICSKPKQGIKIDELVQDVSVVKRINTNTLSYLSSHSEHWKCRRLSGLIPSRLKADILDDEINIYENLFFKMAIDDIASFVTQQILSLKETMRTNQNTCDWESYGEKINDYRRAVLLSKLMLNADTEILKEQNEKYTEQLSKWMEVSKILSAIRSSSFYRKITIKRHINRSIHLTNILKNDQRYKALYDLWCLIRNIRQEEQENKGLSNDIVGNVENYYSIFSILALVYSMHLLKIEFSPTSYFSIDNNKNIKVALEASNGILTYNIKDKITDYGQVCFELSITEHVDIEVPAPKGVMLEKNMFNGLNEFVSLTDDKKILNFYKKPTDILINRMRKFFRTRNKFDNNRKLWNFFLDSLSKEYNLHDPLVHTIVILPVLSNIQVNKTSIESFTEELFKEKDENKCFFIPCVFERFREIKDEGVLRRLLNYGEAYCFNDTDKWKNYKVGILPITQTDIGSFQRLMKFISLNSSKFLMRVETIPKHCPICGSTNIQKYEGDCWKCNEDYCGIEWGKTHCTKGCKKNFDWIRPSKKLSKEEFKCKTKCDLILKKDSLFDRFIITDFEFESQPDGTLKLYPVCPICGARRFK